MEVVLSTEVEEAASEDTTTIVAIEKGEREAGEREVDRSAAGLQNRPRPNGIVNIVVLYCTKYRAPQNDETIETWHGNKIVLKLIFRNFQIS